MKLGTIELEGKFVIAYDTLLDGWDCLKEILDEVRKDADAASFGIPTKKPTRIQVEAANVALHHGLVKYAEEILRACKID